MKTREIPGKNIFTIGETVYDIMFKNGQPVAAKAGGAMLNSSVSLGRLGLPVSLVTEIGNDPAGQTILDFLNENQVNTERAFIFNKGKTALALAFLDEDENAQYDFYKKYPADRLDTKLPKIQKDDLVLFGSFFAVTPEVREKLVKFLKAAKRAGAIILYDPNPRKTSITDQSLVDHYIQENIKFADIVRGSQEDFRMIFNTNTAEETFKKINSKENKFLVYTAGPKSVCYRSKHMSFSVKVPGVNPISTIGAGDNFNAGILYSLYKLKIPRIGLNTLKMQEWEAILDSGVTFGTIVCESYDNYIPLEFAEKLAHRN